MLHLQLICFMNVSSLTHAAPRAMLNSRLQARTKLPATDMHADSAWLLG